MLGKLCAAAPEKRKNLMKWNEDKSILLSQCAVVFFALLLGGMDVGAWWITHYFVELSRLLSGAQYRDLLAVVYLCSVAGWVALWQLWRLLGHIRRGEIFVRENVTAMRGVSWCCFAVMAVCVAGAGLVYPLLLVVAIAAGFMGLIVRIVKNAFQQAIAMKDELDFTV
jgi:hypothetical protein